MRMRVTTAVEAAPPPLAPTFSGGISPATDPPVTVLVDARNVLRSLWPNMPEDEVVELARRWAEERGYEAVIVFDGAAPTGGIGTGPESADDWLTREAAALAKDARRYWLVTSDRELRRRAGQAAEKVIGGGSFARELQGSG
jgi:hypothetical protein